MKKALTKGLMSFTVALGLLSNAHAADKVVVSYLPTLHSLPLFVAINEKMFEKAGITVEATKFENPNQIVDSLVSGRADSAPAGGAAGIVALADTRFPGALRVFGLQGSSKANKGFNDTLIVAKGSSIKSFADLKGKRLAHVPGIQWRTIARTIIKANGLDPDKDVQLAEMAVGLHAQAVSSKTVDAALTLEPIGSIATASGAVESRLMNPAGDFIADPFWAGVGVVTTKFMKERPAVAKRFIAVIDEAVDLINKDYPTYRKHLVGYTAVTPELLNTVAPMWFVSSRTMTDKDVVAYQTFADIFFADGAMKAKIDVKKLLLRQAEIQALSK